MKFDLPSIYDERRKALKWVGLRAGIGLVIFWVIMLFMMPLCDMMDEGFTPYSQALAREFLKQALHNPFLVFYKYGIWAKHFITDNVQHYTWTSFFRWNMPLLPTAVYVWAMYYYILVSPYDFDVKFFGDAHYAFENEIQKMGLYDGNFLFIGKSFGHNMRLPDSRSAYCMGTSGSGKTAGLMIPNALMLDKACLIINDPKSEIFKATSGYRSKLGPVFHFKWTAVDDVKNGEFWPSWNPLGGTNMDSNPFKRNGHLGGIFGYLIPDGPEGTDPYWVTSGRSCMGGMGTYICNKVDQAKANDYFLYRIRENKMDEEDYKVLISHYEAMQQTPEVVRAKGYAKTHQINQDNYLPIGSWKHIPKQWRGKGLNFALIVDTINNWQMQVTKELQERREAHDPSAASMDVWQSIFSEMVMETAYYNYGRLTLLDLNQVLTLPDKQRSSVVSMALSGVNIFKSAASRLRTCENDINFSDLRGIKDVNTGKFYPITIYLTVPYEDLQSSASMLNNLFVNMLSSKLMSNPPGKGKFGPFPVSFLLDDFQHMPVLKSITDGLVFGRSQSNSYFFAFQDWHQLTKKYGGSKADILLNMPAARLVKHCNNPDTRNKLVSGMGQLTKTKYSISSSYAPFNHLNISYKVKYSKFKDNAVSKGGILKMKPTDALLMYTGQTERPISATTPLFFKSSLKAKSSLPPAPHVPDWLLELREEKNPLVYFRLRFDDDIF